MIEFNKHIRKLKKIRRHIYGLRTFIPWLRERHRLEAMVGPLGYWNKLQAYQLNALISNGLKPHHTLLDIGCGPLQGGIAFIKYLEESKYYGIDINESHLDAAKKQIIRYNLLEKKPFLALSESFGNEELNGICFDYIWASQVLYYFNNNKIKSLMKILSTRLKENGKFLGDIMSTNRYEFKTSINGYYLHTAESLNNIANDFNLKVREIGELVKYGYPKRVVASTSVLIEITKKNNNSIRL